MFVHVACQFNDYVLMWAGTGCVRDYDWCSGVWWACLASRYCHIAKEETERHPMNQNILINHGELCSLLA